MAKYLKYIVAVLFILSLLSFSGPSSEAQGLSIAQIRSLIQSLLAQVQILQQKLYQLQSSQISTSTASQSKTPGTLTAVGQVRNYDVVVIGAGTGGTMAAIQAARMGMRVALLEETDWVGGQATAAGVASTDGGGYGGSGLFTEFSNNITNYYQTHGKSVNTCWGSPCYEPSAGQTILRQMMATAAGSTPTSALDLYTLEKVTSVLKNGNMVTGVKTATGDQFNAKIVIDATEYGDVMPLAGASYRLGNGTDSNPSPNSCVQDITYTTTIKKYPNGVPQGFFMTTPPGPATGPESYNVRKVDFAKIVSLNGNETLIYPVDFPYHNTYRGMPDSSNPENYTVQDLNKISKTGINWANDYPTPAPYIYYDGTTTVPINYIENLNFRNQYNCQAKLKTLQFVYYVQHDLNQPLWSVANDEGYGGTYNTLDNSCANIGSAYKTLEKNMSVMPYVREGRRIIGEYTLTASDIKRTVPFRNFYIPSKQFPTSVAVGDYGVDQHNCNATSTLEAGLEIVSDRLNAHAGPFEIPFESFIPESVDGFLVAEKNLSAARMADSALRLQPITMNTGQAAGAIAALAVKNNIQPRNVNPDQVQGALVNAGMKISYYIYSDVPQSNIFWKAIQFVSAHGILVGYGNGNFGVDDSLTRSQAAVVLTKAANLNISNPPTTPTFQDVSSNDFGFAQIEAIYKAGITAGCSLNPKKYCPNDAITRAQFAVFIAKALNFNLSNISQAPYFTDVPATSPYFKSIQYMYEHGITAGCSTDSMKFCPDDILTRGQASAFIANSLWK